ncbi:MAG: hypothetical protein L0154_06795 [Chloroflexi bacterium]|nr:hypothetical protein [Chloroflexota bacterium]
MKLRLIFAVLIMLLIPGLAQAQGDTSPYVAQDQSFSMEIPDDWEIVLEGDASALFRIPIANPGNVAPEGIVAQVESLGVLISLETHDDETAESLVASQLDELGAGSDRGEIILFTVNDLPAASVDEGPAFLGTRWLAIELGEGQFISVMMTGTLEQFWLATPLVLDVLNTLRLKGDKSPVEELLVVEELAETYTRPEDNLTFNYPAHWTLEEQTSYTLLITPTGTTIGISGEEPDGLIDEEFIAFVIDDVTQRLESNTDIVIEDEPLAFEMNDFPGLRMIGTDAASDVSYTYIVFQLNDDVLGIISATGYSGDVRILQGTLMAIAESMSVEE